MSALTFTLTNRPDQRVDMSPLVCNKLEGLSTAEIAAIELQNGKRKIRVDQLFSIKGSDTNNIVIRKFCQIRFYW
jgi:formylmethanofuran dehydrogenase subunit C